jgi:hypothetical protein
VRSQNSPRATVATVGGPRGPNLDKLREKMVKKDMKNLIYKKIQKQLGFV